MFKFGKKKKAAEAPAEASETEAVKGGPADGAGEGEALSIESEPAAKKRSLKMIMVAGAAAVLVLGGGGGAAWFLMAPKGEKAGHHKPSKKKKSGGDHGKSDKPADKNAAVITDGPNGVVFYTLPDIVVNMQTPDGRPTFLKLKLTFELADGSVVEALEPARPRMKDMFQTFLRELRPEDLAGSQGSYQLRMEILRRVNLIVAPSKVNAVLIEEMLIN
jgi:flagellar protein FliL